MVEPPLLKKIRISCDHPPISMVVENKPCLKPPNI